MWAYVAREWASLSTEVTEAWNTMAEGSDLTGKDMFTRAYIAGYDIGE
jgi:hypothetical protein